MDKNLIAYINENWDLHPYESAKALRLMDQSHYPLEMANKEVYDALCQKVAEFADENYLPETWVDEISIEELFFECDALFAEC